jgi:hypothetical protein
MVRVVVSEDVVVCQHLYNKCVVADFEPQLQAFFVAKLGTAGIF